MAKRKIKSEITVYNRIKEVLIEQGRSQVWLAEKLDLDFQTVTRYANNHRQPGIPVLFEIARILKVSPRDLLND